jgi:hypothetical protein
MMKRVLGLAGLVLFTAAAGLLVGCPAPPTTPDPVVGVAPTATPTMPVLTPTAPARGCQSSADCAGGERCDFAPGCGQPGTCGPARSCTKDLVTYCGCDGKTFEGSGSCPDHAHARRGGCEAADSGATTPPLPGSKKACNSDADCSGGEQCQGNEGCGAPWTCGPPRRCTRDSVEWCACDGTMFRGSGTCPARPVRKRGKC